MGVMQNHSIGISYKKYKSLLFLVFLVTFSFTLEAAIFSPSFQAGQDVASESILSKINQDPTSFDWYDSDTIRIGDILIAVQKGDTTRSTTVLGDKWLNGIIYYEFDANVTQTNRDLWLDAAQLWVNGADIEFILRATESNYIYIQNSDENSSFVGMIGGMQLMNIYNWDFPMILAHEIGHALGLRHEQNRPDRDLYVNISTDNIQSDAAYNFLIDPGAQTYQTPYDFESIMHYGECDFSRYGNCPSSVAAVGGRTISVLPPNQSQQAVIGEYTYISAIDKTGMAFRYGGRPNLDADKTVVFNPDPTIFSSDTVLVEGQLYGLRVLVTNYGTATSPATSLIFYRSTNSIISSQDTAMVTIGVPPLSAGEVFNGLAELVAPFSPGSYWVGGCVSAVAKEISTATNCSFGVPASVVAAAFSDLVLLLPGVSDTTLAPGQVFPFDITVDNIGTGGADNTILRYYRSSNSIISIFDTPLATKPVSPVSPGETYWISADLTMPDDLGSYWIGACIDTVSGETNTGNNCSSGVAVTVAVAPDLVIESPAVSPADLTLGESFRIAVLAKNQGSEDSTSSILFYYLSVDETITTSDASFGSSFVGVLAPGALSLEFRDSTAPNTAGKYWLGACISSVAGESNTENNCSAGVEIIVAAQPDLVIQSSRISESIIIPGQPFNATTTVKNQGTGTAGFSTLKYYQSVNDFISTADTLMDTDDVTSLSPGSTHMLFQTLFGPNTSGTYWIGSCVDSVGGETLTNNNCSTGAVITVVDDHCVGDNVVVDDYMFNIDEYCRGTSSITVVAPSSSLGGVSISPGISVSLDAPAVYFNSPFSVSPGASLCIGRSGACGANRSSLSSGTR